MLADQAVSQVNWIESTGSTNADVARFARAGGQHGFVLVADEQTAGRGRRDRTWASPAGASVSMSILLRPGQRGDIGWLSLLAGMAVTRALRGLADDPARVTLKWPNDVLIDGDKVCGILSELVATPDGPAVVVGIGINLSLTRAELPVERATSLALAGLPSQRDEIVHAVLVAFDRLYGGWLESGAPIESYTELCASIGSRLIITVGEGEQVEGVGAGVDADGRLRVVTLAGPRTFVVGDVIHARLMWGPVRVESRDSFRTEYYGTYE